VSPMALVAALWALSWLAMAVTMIVDIALPAIETVG
jgi:hypothetical protein